MHLTVWPFQQHEKVVAIVTPLFSTNSQGSDIVGPCKHSQLKQSEFDKEFAGGSLLPERVLTRMCKGSNPPPPSFQQPVRILNMVWILGVHQEFLCGAHSWESVVEFTGVHGGGGGEGRRVHGLHTVSIQLWYKNIHMHVGFVPVSNINSVPKWVGCKRSCSWYKMAEKSKWSWILYFY